MGNFLEDLSVFDDQPDEARDRAILQFGLGLMQSQNPITGGGPLQSFGNSVQAGLSSLDQDAATRKVDDQQAFQNLITSRGATDTESRTDILGQNADTNLLSAEGNIEAQEASSALGVEQLAQVHKEFDDLGTMRNADVMLKESRARLNDRLPVTPSGSAKSALDKERWTAKFNALWAADFAKDPRDRLYNDVNDPFLSDAAWSAVARESAVKQMQNTPIIAGAGQGENQTPTERAIDIGQNIEAVINPTLAELKQQFSEARKPGDDAKADIMMDFTPEEWQQFMSPPPEVDPTSEAGKRMAEMIRIYTMYPGIARQARKALQLLGKERNN